MRINNKFRYTTNFISNTTTPTVLYDNAPSVLINAVDNLKGSGLKDNTSSMLINAVDNVSENTSSNNNLDNAPSVLINAVDKLIYNIQNNKQIELNEKLEREKRYLKILNDFLNDTYEYSICDFIKLDDINEDYKKYISQNIDKIKNFNGLYGLNFKDIIKLNPNYIKKDIEFCDFCNNKHFKNCCENYKSKNINKTRKGVSHRIRCIVNIKKK